LRADAAVAPEGANANFVAVDADRLRVRTFEKGVEEETLSCGTGALAAALVAWAAEWTADDPVAVATRGGVLHVGREDESEAGRPGGLYLQGPAAVVYRGRIDEGFPAGAG
jgi:diaminopimelate epimerase